MKSKGSSLLIYMALTKEQKKAQITDLTQKLKDTQSVMFAHYIGLSVAEVSDLRQKLKEAEAEMKVAKKTLMKIAAKDAGLPEFEDSAIEGPIACIFSFADPLIGAQVAFKFGKNHPVVELIGGIFEGKVLTKEEATELAKMPSRDVLLATFVAMLRSPLVTFSGMCSSPLGGFARALSQMAEKGGTSEEEVPAQESAEVEDESKEGKEGPAGTEGAESTEEKSAEEENKEPAEKPEEKAKAETESSEPPEEEKKE